MKNIARLPDAANNEKDETTLKHEVNWGDALTINEEMDLAAHYQNLYNNSISIIQTQNCQVDEMIDSPTDNRFGLTLIIRPQPDVRLRIQEFLNELKAIEPEQYYYPDADIHITVMAIISCDEGFNLTQIALDDYVAMIQKCVLNHPPFEIEFRGITASPSCIMVQGFMSDGTLNEIRNTLRTHFRNSTLQQSIDKRYAIQTAHSTVVRFRQSLTHKDEFLKALHSHRNLNFGTFAVHSIDLVFNDWYQRHETLKTLWHFDLDNSLA